AVLPEHGSLRGDVAAHARDDAAFGDVPGLAGRMADVGQRRHDAVAPDPGVGRAADGVPDDMSEVVDAVGDGSPSAQKAEVNPLAVAPEVGVFKEADVGHAHRVTQVV